jgi:hypothetical protein
MTTGNENVEKICVFSIGPGAGECFVDNDPTGMLWRAHEEEASRRGAEFYNYGWVTDNNVILSKTSVGYLESQIDPGTIKVTHRWSEYERDRRRRIAIERLCGNAATNRSAIEALASRLEEMADALHGIAVRLEPRPNE